MSNMDCEMLYLDYLFRERWTKPRYRIKNKSECWKYVNKYEMGRFVGTELVRI